MKPAIFLLLVAFATAIPDNDYYPDSLETEGDPDLEAYLKEAIENFRDQMTKGIEAIHMPVLDPLELKNLNIHVREDVAALDLVIKEITVEGLSKFQFHNIVPDLEDFYMEVNLSLPTLKSWGRYSLDGKLLKIFPLYGNGDFSINVTTAQIAGVGQLDFAVDTLEMTKLELDLTWQDLQIHLDNFLGGGKFSEALQKLLPAIGKGVFDNFKPKILALMNKALINEVNKELKKPEVKKIVDGILPK